MKKLLLLLLLLPAFASAQTRQSDSTFNNMLFRTGRELNQAGQMRNIAIATSIGAGLAVTFAADKGGQGGYYAAAALGIASMVLTIAANSHEAKAGWLLQLASGKVHIPNRADRRRARSR